MENPKKINIADLKTFLKFLDFLNEGIIVIDENKIVNYANKYAENLLGVKEPEGQHFSEVIKNNYLYSIVSHKYNEDIYQTEIIIDSKKFLVKVYNIDNKKFVHLTDITPFEVYKQAKKDFVSNVSHELKTPIAVLKGAIETLDQEEKDKDKKRFISMALKRINQMDTLINDLLIIARLESKEDKVVKTQIDLKRFINDVYEDLSHLTKEKNINFKNNIKENSIIYGDEQKLSILFKNLIENAIKYNKDNGVVEVNSFENGKYIVVEVKDTGIGIPKKALPLIFERFYRVDKSRSRSVGGTGLGLSIVKHITEAHKGKVEVDSKLGEGSSFKVYLPKQ
ncbi:sensor histidine kinase [Hydrogenothermus marinus]|uniref:histidine kinase n=1 Tax=Hydrogenothermus marinus TaxID=133270 RepID=A0A3M0BII5_9AQUI|nr:ATP-binding protein [Hydrogenothermus marinus]RMA97253.1 two-component system phosphate regulon sensor histidine kinase PhoR [Hydrogenothermus marinus]